MKSDLAYLASMVEAIEKIMNFTQVSGLQKDAIESAILYELIKIGEGATKLPASLRDSYQDVPWRKIISLRNVLVHNYLGVDMSEVMLIVNQRLPELKNSIQKIISDLTTRGQNG